jgi:hypothetical protein
MNYPTADLSSLLPLATAEAWKGSINAYASADIKSGDVTVCRVYGESVERAKENARQIACALNNPSVPVNFDRLQIKQFARATSSAFCHGELNDQQIVDRAFALPTRQALLFLTEVLSYLPDSAERRIRGLI